MRSTSWGIESNLRYQGRNTEKNYKIHLTRKGSRTGVTGIRIFKRLLPTNQASKDRVVFIIRSVNKLEVGQVIFSKSTKMAIFTSTIQTFTTEALNKIILFMESLEAGLVEELILLDGNEVKLN